LQLGGGRPFLLSVTVDGGDGDDQLTAEGIDAPSVLRGGLGDDMLQAGPGGASLDGGPGRDRVIGGPGRDTLSMSTSALADGDALDGGSGDDLLVLDHLRLAAIDLAAATLTAGAQTATLMRVETLVSDASRLALRGTAAPDELKPIGDVALIDGRGGDDTLIAPAVSADRPLRLRGGAGDDRLVVSTGRSTARTAPMLDCGTGRDTVENPARAIVPGDCERVAVRRVATLTAPRALGNRLVLSARPDPTACGAVIGARAADGSELATPRRVRRTGRWRELRLALHSRSTPRRLRLSVRAAHQCPRRATWHDGPATTIVFAR
jgi:hypothetical protein